MEEFDIALEFLDYDIDSSFGVLNTSCNLALEQQKTDPVIYEEGISGSGLFYPTDPKNDTGTYKRLVYHQILRAFYNNYRNPLEIFGIENVDFQTSKTERYLNDFFRVFSLPPSHLGDKVVEGSVTFVDNTFDDNYIVVDDGNGNLFAKSNLFSKVQEVRAIRNDLEEGTILHGCPGAVVLPPNVPSQLSASALSPSSSYINWTDNSDNELGFLVWRSFDSGSTWAYIGSVGENVGSLYDYVGLDQTSSYSYRVAAYNAIGSSSYSNTASITTPPA
jgi:hypothetical protein